MNEFNRRGYDDQGIHWSAYGTCQDLGAPSMFPDEKDVAAIAAARNECMLCPVKTVCLAEALRNGERFGIWGGYTPGERQKMNRRRVVLVKVP